MLTTIKHLAIGAIAMLAWMGFVMLLLMAVDKGLDAIFPPKPKIIICVFVGTDQPLPRVAGTRMAEKHPIDTRSDTTRSGIHGDLQSC